MDPRIVISAGLVIWVLCVVVMGRVPFRRGDDYTRAKDPRRFWSYVAWLLLLAVSFYLASTL